MSKIVFLVAPRASCRGGGGPMQPIKMTNGKGRSAVRPMTLVVTLPLNGSERAQTGWSFEWGWRVGIFDDVMEIKVLLTLVHSCDNSTQLLSKQSAWPATTTVDHGYFALFAHNLNPLPNSELSPWDFKTFFGHSNCCGNKAPNHQH